MDDKEKTKREAVISAINVWGDDLDAGAMERLLERVFDAGVAYASSGQPADSPDAERVGEQGPFLPCPICRGIEGCDHAIPERRRAYLQLSSRLAEADEIIKNAAEALPFLDFPTSVIKAAREYRKKYPKGENL